jgi:two-component system response regulator HydG
VTPLLPPEEAFAPYHSALLTPPLRERQGDVLLLAQECIARFNALYNKTVQEIAPEAVDFLVHYAWPGNVRELKNVIQRAVLVAPGSVLTVDLLPERVRDAAATKSPGPPDAVRLGMTLSDMEREHIAMILASTGGNKKAAAQILGISRRALYNKLKRYNLR